MYGNFSPEAIEAFTEAVGEENFSEGLFDFTTCERSDGSLYGTSGHCRKGTQTDSHAKEQAAAAGATPKPKSMESLKTAAARAKAKFNKEEMESPKNQADMDHAGLMKLMAKSPTAQRKLREAAEAKAKENKSGMRDSSLAESRKAMRHQREQMNLHSNKIAELQDAGKKVPPALQSKYDLAKASYNSHRKAINDATGVEKKPVMQEARERGRAAEKENQAKRALQRGEESVAKAAARAKAKFNKEEMESPKNQADMDHEGLKKLMAKSPTAQRQLREAAEAKAQAGK